MVGVPVAGMIDEGGNLGEGRHSPGYFVVVEGSLSSVHSLDSKEGGVGRDGTAGV